MTVRELECLVDANVIVLHLTAQLLVAFMDSPGGGPGATGRNCPALKSAEVGRARQYRSESRPRRFRNRTPGGGGWAFIN